MESSASEHKINKYFLLAIILLFGAFLFISLIQFFTAFLGAIMFYVLSKPFMEYLLKKGWKKHWASILIMIISFFIILVPVCFFGGMVYNKIAGFVSQPDLIVGSLQKLDRQLQTKYNFQLLSDKNIAQIQSVATSAISSILNESLTLISGIIMMYFFFYFMLMKTNRMEASIIFYLPFPRKKIEMFGRELVAQTFANSVGIPAIALAQGLCGYAAYAIAGVPQAAFWGVLTGFSSIVPVIGTAIIWAPVALYLVALGHTWQFFFVVAWCALILGTVDNVIRFMLARKMADVHPVITVLGVIIGLRYFSIPGLIFGPLLISYFVIFLRIYYTEYQQPNANGNYTAKKVRISSNHLNLPFRRKK